MMVNITTDINIPKCINVNTFCRSCIVKRNIHELSPNQITTLIELADLSHTIINAQGVIRNSSTRCVYEIT